MFKLMQGCRSFTSQLETNITNGIRRKFTQNSINKNSQISKDIITTNTSVKGIKITDKVNGKKTIFYRTIETWKNISPNVKYAIGIYVSGATLSHLHAGYRNGTEELSLYRKWKNYQANNNGNSNPADKYLYCSDLKISSYRYDIYRSSNFDESNIIWYGCNRNSCDKFWNSVTWPFDLANACATYIVLYMNKEEPPTSKPTTASPTTASTSASASKTTYDLTPPYMPVP